MEPTFEAGRWSVTLRATGKFRWLVAAFLSFWLIGWAVGEAFGLGTLLACLGGMFAPDVMRELGLERMARIPRGAWGMIAFLTVWVSFWTLGGILALREMLSLLWGRDRLEYDATGVRLARAIGPFRSSREWPAPSIRGVHLVFGRPGLALDTDRGTVVITRYGTPGEHTVLRDGMRRALNLRPPAIGAATLPEGWESEPSADGSTLLFRRRSIRAAQARTSWIVAGVLGMILGAVGLRPVLEGSWSPGAVSGSLVLAAFVLALVALAAWLTWGRNEIAVRTGAIEFRSTLRGRTRADAYVPERLHLTRSSDSDGDQWFSLAVIEGRRRRHVLRTMNDPLPVLTLGRWLSLRGGVRLDVDGGIEDVERFATTG